MWLKARCAMSTSPLMVSACVSIVLSAAALPPAVLAMTPAQKSACTTILTLRGWHPPLTLAGTVPASQAISLLRQGLNWQQKFITTTQLDSKTNAIKNDLWDSVRNFNLAALYGKLPSQNGDWHSFSLRGHLTPTHYRVNQIAPGAFEQPLTSLGDTVSQLGMRPRPTPQNGPSGDRYELRARTRANIGPITWDNALNALWMTLHHLTTAVPIPTPNGGGLVEGTGSDAEILLQLQPAFPNAYRWYLGIADIPNLLAHGIGSSSARHLHLTLQFNDGLRKHYPQVAAYFEQLKGFISAKVAMQNKMGHWLNIDFDSKKERLTIDGWVLDGHLIPSRNGRPLTNAIDTHVALDSLSFQTVSDLTLKALGVTVKLGQWPADWHYRRSDHGADSTARITQQPTIQISGAALGFIPVGVVDAVIPSNIEGIVHDFMQVLTHSNGGNGVELRMDYADNPSSGGIMSASADGNTLDNFFVHFAVSLVNRRILPNDAQFQGLKRLANDGLTAVGEDMNGLVTAETAVHKVDLPTLVKQCRSTN